MDSYGGNPQKCGFLFVYMIVGCHNGQFVNRPYDVVLKGLFYCRGSFPLCALWVRPPVNLFFSGGRRDPPLRLNFKGCYETKEMQCISTITINYPLSTINWHKKARLIGDRKNRCRMDKPSQRCIQILHRRRFVHSKKNTKKEKP